MQAFFIITLIVLLLFGGCNGCRCLLSSPNVSYCRAQWVAHLKLNIVASKRPLKNDPQNLGLSNDEYFVTYLTIYKQPDEFNATTLPPRILTPSQSAACGIELDVCKEYLLAGNVEGDQLTTSLCSQIVDHSSGGNALPIADAIIWSNVPEEIKKALETKEYDNCV